MSTKEDNSPPFVPEADVIIHVAKSDMSLYPMLEQGSNHVERAYTFHINNNVIEDIPVDTCLKIDSVGTELSEAAFVNGAKNE